MSETNPTLTPLALAALRQCDDVAFFHRDGQSYMRAIKRARPTEKDPFASEHVIEIPCHTAWCDYARQLGQSWPIPAFQGFEVVGNYHESGLQTTIAHLKAGDILTLRWVKDGGNKYTKDAGLHHDSLWLVVTRGEKCKRYTFHIDESICPDHNSARMIRDVRYPEPAVA